MSTPESFEALRRANPRNRAGFAEAVDRVLNDWRRHSKAARDCAIECFDSVKNLKMILS